MLLAQLPAWFVDAATFFGVVGTIATLIGLWWTLWQVRETKKAAVAARDAALATAEADRIEFARYVTTNSHRLLREAILYIDNEQYPLAAIRAADLADHLAQIARSSPEWAVGWEADVQALRSLEGILKATASAGRTFPPGSLKKWRVLQERLYGRIDAVHGPFLSSRENEP